MAAGLRLALAALWQLAAGGRALELAGPEGSRGRAARCQPVDIPMCRGIGYNLTRMPNLLGHESQREAALKLHEFAPLVEYGCHVHLRFFLCSLYAPMCTHQVSASIPACRPMCEQARHKCVPIMEQFNFGWPDSLDCARLPTKNDPNALCMEAPENASAAEPHKGQGMLPVAPRPWPPGAAEGRGPDGLGACDNPEKFQYVEKSLSCAPRCSPGVDVYWSREDKDFAFIWMAVWSTLCFVSTAFTVLTFLLDPHRFQYPERPIIFLSMCYNVYSAANCSLEASVPTVAVFMLKIFMSLVGGCITSGVWVWSSKTLQTWQSLCNRKLGVRTRGKPCSGVEGQALAAGVSCGGGHGHYKAPAVVLHMAKADPYLDNPTHV
ncbi:LOW QUALITY PROTEIN: frizzled-9 [Opisthocomus hoazin]|uniref:LOW QUALITY PROTEIN: frizzled-9 n=1 Tax=Opisthocomus hoazin TaxID=30419 RepID=UPI003F534B58